MPRGGPQRLRVTRPEVVHPLGPPPWGEVPSAERHVSIDRIVRAMAAAPHPKVVSLSGGEAEATSAVLVPVFEENGEAWLVMTRRAEHLRRNAGDVAFPGGHTEDGEDAPTTALREAEEEIGLSPDGVQLLGELDHMVTLWGMEMVPVVGVLPERPRDLVADPGEVSAILTFPVAELLVDEHYRGEDWGDRQMHEFDLEGDTIWGATARILHRLIEVILAVPVG